MNLNDEQKHIIELCKSENLRVNAVAGSGKTTALANAYIEIIEDMLRKNYKLPDATNKILVLTFTNDAAYDLKKKIYELLMEKYNFTDSLNYISTIHSFSNLLFNELIIPLKINPNYKIDEEYELESLKREAFERVIVKNRSYTNLINEFFNIELTGSETSFETLLATLYEKSRQFGWDIDSIKVKFINDEILKNLKVTSQELTLIKRLLEVVKSLLICYIQELDALKFETGTFEFEDLVYYPYLYLKNNDDYRSKWNNKFDYILIDEYQDTSILQFEFIKLLKNNSKISLFGDYYQSIYEWRDASPEYMINQPQFKTVSMTKNYRSGKNIISFINNIFSKIFYGSELPFNVMVPNSLTDSEVLIFETDGENTEARIKHEAELFSKMIEYLVYNKHIEYRDITMLFRTKTHLEKYVKELQKHGIEYVLITNNDFFKIEEIQFLINYLFFLDLQHSEYAYYYFAKIIKSPVYGGDDALLWTVVKNNKEFFKIENIEILKKFRQHVDILNLYKNKKKDLLLLKLLELTNLDLCYLSNVNGFQKYANIYKFIDLIRKLEELQVLEYSEFIMSLKKLIKNEEEGEAIVNDKEDNAVKIMTVHANKGLQAKAVLLPGMFTYPRPERYDYLFDREYGFLFNLGVLKEDYSEILKRIIEHLKLSNKREEESLRLLYVALTRAESYLIFSLDLNSKFRKKSDWSHVIVNNLEKSELNKYIDNSKEILNNIDKIEKKAEKHDKIELKLATIKVQEKKVYMLSPTMINTYLHCPRKYYYLTNFGTKSSKTEPLKFGEKLHLLLKEGSLDLEDSDLDIKANQLVTEIYNTDFWHNMISSKNYRELPFLINFNQTIISGTIDLVYEQNEEWNIVDYKTQGIDIDQYRGQLLCYVLGLYYLKYYRAKKIGLYSIKNKKLVMEDAPDIEHIESIIREIISNIENDKFPRISNENCDNCEFSDLCKNDEP